jgi:hypothetical protein
MIRARVLTSWSLLLAAVACLVGVAGAPPAAAHSRTGTLELVSIEAGDDGSATVTVELSYDGDGHPVLDGVVQLGGRRSDGIWLMPVTFSPTDEPGQLIASAEMPGPEVWDLRVTSSEPAAELVATYDPANPTAAAGSAEGGRFTDARGAGVPARWIAIGCGLVLAVFVVARLRDVRRRGVAGDAEAG